MSESGNRDATYIERIAQVIWWESGGEGAWYPPDEASLWLGYAVLCVAKRERVTSSDVHQAWSAWAVIKHHGNHKSLVPFADLTKEVQAYDDLYRDAIRRTAKMLGRCGRLYGHDEMNMNAWHELVNRQIEATKEHAPS